MSNDNRLGMIVATLYWKGWAKCVSSWQETAKLSAEYRIFGGMKLLEAYQKGFEESPEEILGFVHDDLYINEFGWDERVMAEFEDPSVALVGFGGALMLSSPLLYQLPFSAEHVGRWKFRSNMRDAETHGERFTGSCNVACLDGFSMFVRRTVLQNSPFQGWPHGITLGYHGYDLWLSAEVRRQGLKTRLIGVKCDHIGWRTSVMTKEPDNRDEAYRWLYDNFRGTIPFEVQP